MKRREFLGALGGAAVGWPLAARAQRPGKIPRIGYLSPASASTGAGLARDEAFREGLRELGYVEGKNIVIEHRFADGRFDRLADLAAELVRLEVDVIVAVVTQASLAAKQATSTIPIVMVGVSDPLGSGLVASLARPGGNVTGTSSMTAEVAGKSLELLKEAAPAVSRVAVLWNPDNAIFQAQMLRQTQLAAAMLGVELRTVAARHGDDLEGAFGAIAAESVGALLVLADPTLAIHRKRIVDFADKSRLPAMYGMKDYAAAGGLMTYAPNLTDQFRRAAAHTDKILKGAKPADIPVEQPTAFELVINLEAAKALRLTMPPTLVGRADEVIE
jgi:putative ABC transport system substrate-binding protein